MHVAIALALGLLAFAVLVLLAGLTPFIGIPIAILIFLIPIAWVAGAGRLTAERGGGAPDKSGVPSSGEASYQPTVDPAERGP